MSSYEGTIKQVYNNPKDVNMVFEDGFSCKAWNGRDGSKANVAVGQRVSFAYTSKPNPSDPSKPWNSVKGEIAVVGGQAASPASQAAPMASHGRQGVQVGAAINQAVAYLSAAEQEITIEGVEHIAEEMLHMSDRLMKVESK